MRRAAYRLRQVYYALTAHPSASDLALAESVLGPALFTLFQGLPRPDQAHALRVFHRLRADAPDDLGLQQAALLHDVGKARFPLSLLERSLIVLAERWMPRRTSRGGSGDPAGWRRPFVIASQHPAWGATMAEQAGASPDVVGLIRDHQIPTSPARLGEAGDRLAALQTADGEN